MAKRKSSKNSDQPELPLDSTVVPIPTKAEPTPDPKSAPTVPNADRDSATETAAIEPPPPRKKGQKVQDDKAPLAQHYRNWFLEYASYVILDRAVPHIDDGLKPVQRRILHTLWEMDDGRFHKVANVVGRTMAFHPHGDALSAPPSWPSANVPS